jgi:hypothetical protein
MRGHISSPVFRFSCWTLFCLLGFAVLVLLLQRAQEAYDWHSQLISELALGKGGGMMFFAFLALAGACVGLSRVLLQVLSHARCKNGSCRLRRALAFSFFLAAAGFFVAGAITLQDDAWAHIISVLLAFAALLLNMFVVLRSAPALVLRIGTGAAILVVMVALLPIGLRAGEAQRLIASGILGWMAYVCIFSLLSGKR